MFILCWRILCTVEDRKDWLRAFKAGTHADYNVESVTYESFINKELILFSVSIKTKRNSELEYMAVLQNCS